MEGKLFWVILTLQCLLYKIVYISAQVDLSLCKTLSCWTILFHFSNLLRILIGPFPYTGVVAVHYGCAVATLSCITMGTFKTILKTLFLLDFNRMISISEKKVMICFLAVTSTSTLAILMQEITVRQRLGIHHFARRCFNIYLGQVGSKTLIYTLFICMQGNIDDPLRNQSITSSILTIPLLTMVCSLLIYNLVRLKTNKLSLIHKYQTSITESSANGLTNIATSVVMLIITILCVGSYKSLEVGMVLISSTVIIFVVTALQDEDQQQDREQMWTRRPYPWKPELLDFFIHTQLFMGALERRGQTTPVP